MPLVAWIGFTPAIESGSFTFEDLKAPKNDLNSSAIVH